MRSPLDVVAVQIALLPQVKLAVGDYRRGPRVEGAARDLEPRYFLVGGGRGLDQPDRAVLAHAIEVLVGIDAIAFADAAVFPRNLPRS